VRWENIRALLSASRCHVCCAVRAALVILGGFVPGVGVRQEGSRSPRVEMLSRGARAFVELPPLSCSAFYDAAAIVVDETLNLSASGHMLLFGGRAQDGMTTSSVTGGSGHWRMHTAG
jgi:hypothetical protein